MEIHAQKTTSSHKMLIPTSHFLTPISSHKFCYVLDVQPYQLIAMGFPCHLQIELRESRFIQLSSFKSRRAKLKCFDLYQEGTFLYTSFSTNLMIISHMATSSVVNFVGERSAMYTTFHDTVPFYLFAGQFFSLEISCHDLDSLFQILLGINNILKIWNLVTEHIMYSYRFISIR